MDLYGIFVVFNKFQTDIKLESWEDGIQRTCSIRTNLLRCCADLGRAQLQPPRCTSAPVAFCFCWISCPKKSCPNDNSWGWTWLNMVEQHHKSQHCLLGLLSVLNEDKEKRDCNRLNRLQHSPSVSYWSWPRDAKFSTGPLRSLLACLLQP